MSGYQDYFDHHTGRQIDKWVHYFPIYDRHFDRFRGKAPRVLEIGVDHGGSLEMWRKYFGPAASIVGIDNRPECRFSDDGIMVYTGDQRDRVFLESLGEFDIVIDDGSHRREDQTASFEALWPHTHGVYLIEDCHHNDYPYLGSANLLRFNYPWVVVVERPKRVIRGTPSRELRPDEQAAREAFGVRPVC